MFETLGRNCAGEATSNPKRDRSPSGEQETATAGTKGRDAVPPSLDFSDDESGSRVGSPIGGELSPDMHGSGSTGVGYYYNKLMNINMTW